MKYRVTVRDYGVFSGVIEADDEDQAFEIAEKRYDEVLLLMDAGTESIDIEEV